MANAFFPSSINAMQKIAGASGAFGGLEGGGVFGTFVKETQSHMIHLGGGNYYKKSASQSSHSNPCTLVGCLLMAR